MPPPLYRSVFLLIWIITCTSATSTLTDADRLPLSGDERRLVSFVQDNVPPSTLAHLGWTDHTTLVTAIRAPTFLQFVEGFCGIGRLYDEALQVGLRARALDLSMSSAHDILDDRGFGMFLTTLLMLAPGSTFWLGVPCSTFVWIAMGHTHRRASNPEGDTTNRMVADANLLLFRVVILCCICVMRSVLFIIEQPAGTLLFKMQVWLRFMSLAPRVLQVPLRRHHLWLGGLGHVLPKPTVLWGCHPALTRIIGKRPTSRMVIHNRAKVGTVAWSSWVNKFGRRRWCGNRKNDGLKRSGEYPLEFAKVVIQHVRHTCDASRVW